MKTSLAVVWHPEANFFRSDSALLLAGTPGYGYDWGN
jgi:hypothetical protein